jgi:hypothetical protein
MFLGFKPGAGACGFSIGVAVNAGVAGFAVAGSIARSMQAPAINPMINTERTSQWRCLFMMDLLR